MRKYYTRPCNFYYGSYARKLVAKKKGFYLAGNPNIAFDRLEIFRIKKTDMCTYCPNSELAHLRVWTAKSHKDILEIFHGSSY